LVERLIRNFKLPLYVIDSAFGHEVVSSVESARRALFEPDFEPKFPVPALVRLRSKSKGQPVCYQRVRKINSPSPAAI
jgi:hypothetical protein